MTSRIADAFRDNNRPLLVACTVAGDPDYATSVMTIRAIADAGADIIELVMPFSDPVADGPVIQQAGARALSAGMNTDRLFDLVRDAMHAIRVPLVIMTYANIVLQHGIGKFYRDAARAGADGVIVADVPLEEADPFCTAAEKAGIDPILFISQTTSRDRMEQILSRAGGFVYLVAAQGVTGAREEVSPATLALIREVKGKTQLPVVPGFGIATPAHVRTYAQAGADGVIVGSALVRVIDEYHDRPVEMTESVGQLVRDLAGATRA